MWSIWSWLVVVVGVVLVEHLKVEVVVRVRVVCLLVLLA
jgi:hypothetical protein